MDRYRDLKIVKQQHTGRYYRNLLYPPIPITSEDEYLIARSGDRIDNLALEFYNDIDLWWVITQANPDRIRRDSFFIKPGTVVRIPVGIQTIIEKFHNLNKDR
tara:strand:+ start:105 stop:413 length:309 start_codon:yes stop_codon:yes gene_type:complete